MKFKWKEEKDSPTFDLSLTEFCWVFPTFFIVEDALELSDTVLDSDAATEITHVIKSM